MHLSRTFRSNSIANFTYLKAVHIECEAEVITILWELKKKSLWQNLFLHRHGTLKLVLIK